MLRNLLSLLIYYQHNFKMLHWKVTGELFEIYHGLASEYYDKFGEFIDSIAEIGITMGYEPVDLVEAYALLERDKSHDFKIIKSGQNFTTKEVVENFDIMICDIIKYIDEYYKTSEVKDNIPIRVELESMYQYLNIEGKYKNKRR